MGKLLIQKRLDAFSGPAYKLLSVTSLPKVLKMTLQPKHGGGRMDSIECRRNTRNITPRDKSVKLQPHAAEPYVLFDHDKLYLKRTEESVGKQHQSANGQFITPRPITEYMARCIKEFATIPLREVADLGAGPGALTQACLSTIGELQRLDVYDIDEHALDYLRMRVRSEKVHTHCKDLLMSPELSPIDGVISNPPYLLSRRIGSGRTKRIRDTGWFTTARGKLNTFGLFIELGVRALRRGGVGSFIVPIAVTNLADHQVLRDFLISNCEMIHATWFPEQDPFAGQNINVKTCVLTVRKGRTDSTQYVCTGWRNGRTCEERRAELKVGDQFYTYAAMGWERRNGTLLSEDFDVVAIGFNLSKGWHDVVERNRDSGHGKNMIDVIRGRDISESGFKCRLRIDYLWLERHNLVPRKCDYALHNSARPRIVVADISSRIKAVLLTRPVLPMNSVKVIYHKRDDLAALQHLLDYLRADEARTKLKDGSPNLHLTKSNLNSLIIPPVGD